VLRDTLRFFDIYNITYQKKKKKRGAPSSDTIAGSRTTSGEAEIGLRELRALHKKLAI
jgi:hypothetical protein